MSAFLEFLSAPRQAFFKEQDPTAAYQLIKPYLWKRGLSTTEKRATFELGGLILRSQKRFEEAVQLYKEIQDDYQAGYCMMLLGRLADVRHFWSRVAAKRQNHWCVSLFGMLSHQVSSYPTLLQIRNHLETDVANLIHANQMPLLENLFLYADFLAQLNMETYKFYGRSLLYAGWLDKAEVYLLAGQKLLPHDPEIYYHLGQYSVQREGFQDARLMLNQCLLISPAYTPAKDLLEKLEKTSAPEEAS